MVCGDDPTFVGYDSELDKVRAAMEEAFLRKVERHLGGGEKGPPRSAVVEPRRPLDARRLAYE
eukprot:15451043-Alexandrium_andersonii.AAC.1